MSFVFWYEISFLESLTHQKIAEYFICVSLQIFQSVSLPTLFHLIDDFYIATNGKVCTIGQKSLYYGERTLSDR